MKNEDKTEFIPTERNKDLEPLPTGVGIIGYNSEIHKEDSLEFSYKLPIGAIKRLIQSYYEEMKDLDEEDIYMCACLGLTKYGCIPTVPVCCRKSKNNLINTDWREEK